MNRQRIIAIASLVLLVGILALLRYPQLAVFPVAVLAFIILLLLFIDYPFQTFLTVLGIRVLLDRFSEFGMGLGGLHLNISAFLALAIIAITPCVIVIRHKQIRSLSTITVFGLFVILGCVSVLYGSFPQSAFGDAIRLLSYACVLILSILIITPERYNQFLRLFPLYLLIPSLFAITQLLTGTGFYDFGVLKPVGTFFHPNYLAYGSLVALVVVVVNIIHLYRNRSQVTRYELRMMSYTLFGGLLLFLILKAHSLGAIFALILMVGLIMIQTINKKLIFLGVIGLFLAVLFPWYNYQLNQQGFSIVHNPTFKTIIGESQEDGSFLWRVRNWQSMFTYIIQKPALGWGLGSYKPLRAEQAEYETDLLALEAHNDYMNFTVELGLVGVGLLTASLLTFVAKILWSSAPHNGERFIASPQDLFNTPNLFIGSLLLATMIAMSVENIFKGAAIMWPLFALVGATMANNIQQTAENKKGEL